MIYVDLPLQEIKEKLVAYGLTKTSSKRFIRYEGDFEKARVGVEINKYHNFYELTCYVFECVYYHTIINDLSHHLIKLFSDNLVAIE